MALSQDALTAPIGTAGGTGTLEGAHTPAGTPKAVLVFVGQIGSGADQVSKVTYGGVEMERLEGRFQVTAQVGASYLYFLAAPPIGKQTVKVTVSGAAAKAAACVTVAATGNVAVVAHGGLTGEKLTNPSFNLETPASTETIVYGITFSGEGEAGTGPGTGYTQVYEVGTAGEDLLIERRTANGTGGSIAVSWTYNNDTAAACGVALQEEEEAGGAVTLPNATAAGTSSAVASLHAPVTLPPTSAAGSSSATASLSVPSTAVLPQATAAGTSAVIAALSVQPRLTAIAAGISNALAFLTTPKAAVARRLERKPPLALDLEVENAAGDVTNLRQDSRKATDRPFGLNCGSERGEGFSTANASFLRDIYRDYPDLNLLDTWRFVGREGSIAYEGRLAGLPRSNDPPTFTLNLVGWMTYLKSKQVPMLIVDRRTGGWVGPSNARLSTLLSTFSRRMEGAMTTGWQYEGLAPGVVFTFTNFDAVFGEQGEAALYAGGEDIGDLRFDLVQLAGGGATTDWSVVGALTSDDVWTSADITPNLTNANVAGVVIAATALGRKFAMLSQAYLGPTTGTQNEVLAYLNPRITGTHGLTPVGASPEEGYELTDIVEYMLATYFTKVSLAPTSPRSTFPVQQFTGHDVERDGVDSLQTLNNLILWETNMWEDRKLHMEPADLTKVDWWIDTTWSGVKVNYQGATIEDFATGIVVTYTDFYGHTYKLRPDEHAELLDPNPNNPAYRHGEDLWISKTVPWPCLEAEALQFGRAQLAEQNRPRRPGSFTVMGGYIKDAAGHWQQGWKMRNSQTLGVKNHPDETEPRLIHTPRYDEESSTLTIAIDAPPQTLEALVARQALAREARNLT